MIFAPPGLRYKRLQMAFKQYAERTRPSSFVTSITMPRFKLPGNSANSAFEEARYVLVLPEHQLGLTEKRPVWLACDSKGALQHPENGTYTLSYGDAVDLGYCRPTTFHRHEGKFNVVVDNDEQIEVSGTKDISIPEGNPASAALKNALEFYKVVCTPKFLKTAHP